tara:strand:- start:7471 stop:7788 length:318 start_codon:yes stop_codon:yes gene_type:complete
MKCWHCGTELIWGGDHDIDHEDEDYCMETNLSCPDCGSFHMVYLPKDKQEDKQIWIEGYKEWLDKDKEPEMWSHYCEIECSDMMIGKGEACSWCGEEEKIEKGSS